MGEAERRTIYGGETVSIVPVTCTVPVTPAAKFDWHNLIGIFEMMGNVAEAAIPGGAVFIPLTNALEQQFLNPLLMSIGQGKTTITNEIMAFYGAAIAALTILKQQTGLDPALLAKISAWILRAQNAMAEWTATGLGFDPTVYTPVSPIA